MQKTKYDSINEEFTKKAKQDPKYQIFLDWLTSNGSIIDPRVEYPVAFGPRGYIGIATAGDIESYQGIIVIPKSLIIDVNKVLQTEQLRSIFLKNPHMFGQSDQQQNNFNMLALYLIYERAKGKGSFFKPYFDAAECQNLIAHWTQEDLLELESSAISAQIKKYKDGIETQGKDFLDVIVSRPDLFPQEIQPRTYIQYFQWSFQFIMTRAFGWSVPESYLIPFADMLNHGQHSVDHCIIDISKQMSLLTADYVSKSKKCDLSILKHAALSQRSRRSAQIKRKRPSRRMKYILDHKQYLDQEDMLQQNSKQLMYKISYQEYALGKKRFRQLFFDQSSCTQDNDTQNSDVVSKQYNKEIIKIEDKQILRTRSKSLHASLSDYWKTYTHKRIIPIVGTSQDDKMLVDLSQNSQKSISQASDVSREDQYQWVNEANPKDIFFVLYTTSKYKKGEQLYNFYGKRPNKFFVICYNFALLTNKYDSYGLRLYFNNTEMEPDQYIFDITQFLSRKASTQGATTEVRLKMKRVSIQLINHCRAMILSKFTNKQNLFGIPVTIPVNKILQQKAIQYCKQIVKYKLGSFNTTIQQDYQILDGKIENSRLQTAVIVRLSYKLILNQQLQYLDWCLDVLRRWQGGKLSFSLEEMDKIVRIKDYICILDRSLF